MNLNWKTFCYKIVIGTGLAIGGYVFSQTTTPDCVCEEPINVWYKLSTGEDGIQRTVELDMSRGVSYSEGPFIILELQDRVSKEIIYVAFPNGGPWTGEKPIDPFLEELHRQFKDLEEYLNATQGKGTEIKKQ
tara:strand:+ start:191 stop:589 length:399 start_codon:yes stop_codon:yes gene_type:complete